MVIVVKLVNPAVMSAQAARRASSMAPGVVGAPGGIVYSQMASQMASSPALRWAVGGWSFFIAENFILSENRSRIIESLGEDGYHYAYGACSTAAVSSIVYGYFYKVQGVQPLRWAKGLSVPTRWKVASFAVQGLGAVLASQSVPTFQIPLSFGSSSDDETTTKSQDDTSNTSAVMGPPPTATPTSSRWKVRCPFDFADSASKTSLLTGDNEDSFQPRGLDRVTRHPGLWSFGLMGLGNAMLVPSVPQAACLAMPLMVALIGGAHQDSRHRRGLGGTLSRQQDISTSNVPFLAMIMGTQGDNAASEFVTKEVKVLNAAMALSAVGLWVAKRGSGGTAAIKKGISTLTRSV